MSDRALSVIDTHAHVRSRDESRYPLAPTGIGSDWWVGGDCSTEALLSRIEAGGVAAAVLVQAVGPYGYDNSYVLDSSGLAPERLTVVVAVDLDDTAVGAQIERFAEHPRVRGVRFFGMTADSRWIGTRAASSAFDVAARAGLAVIVTVPGERLGELRREILDAETQVVLDHCGFPVYQNGTIASDQEVLRFASAEHVMLKITTHSFEHAAAGGGSPDGVRLVTEMAARFGVPRLMWGSDFPQTAREDYPGLVGRARHAARELDGGQQAAFLGGTAMRLFGNDRISGALNVESVRTALEPLTRTLAADSYRLIVRSADRGVATLDVVADAHACADCLVPRAVFEAIAADQLSAAYPAIPVRLEVGRYPSTH
jgi:L-fuconolactonase